MYFQALPQLSYKLRIWKLKKKFPTAAVSFLFTKLHVETKINIRNLPSMVEKEWYFSWLPRATVTCNKIKGKSLSNSTESQFWVRYLIYWPLTYPNNFLCFYTYIYRNKICSWENKNKIKAYIKHLLFDFDLSHTINCVYSCFIGIHSSFLRRVKNYNRESGLNKHILRNVKNLSIHFCFVV